MGMGGGTMRSLFDVIRRDQEQRPGFEYQAVTPNVYIPEDYIRETSQPVVGYAPGQFEFSPYAQAYLSQLSQPQQFQQTLSPNLTSGLAALAEAYGIANPLASMAPAAPTTDSAPAAVPAASAAE